MSDVQELARQELATRELARRHFDDFCPYVYKGYPDTPHLHLLADHLQEVERYIASKGKEGIGRLMVFMPPRHWKSTTTSVLFPTWFLGRNPDCRVIMASYNSSLATGFSRRARNHMLDNPYRAVFGDKSARPGPVGISDDSRSVESWEVAGHRGGMTAAGVGSGITGKGANLFVIDDPHKDRADVESVVKREAVWNWWTSTAYTRLEDGAAVVLILTRWHPEDLAGKLIKAMLEDPLADRWTILCLTALAEEWSREVEQEEVTKAVKEGWFMSVDPLGRAPGEALWEEVFGLETLRTIKANVGGYDWVSLYQQRPRRLEGQIIKAHQIKIIGEDEVPPDVRWVRYWDLAVGRSKKAHHLAGAKCGRDKQRRFYIGHIKRIPAPWSEARPKIKRTMLNDPMEVVQGIEVAGQQDGYYQEFRDDIDLQSRSIVPVAPRGDKVARAQLWATRVEDDLVYMVRGPWNDDFVSECVAFPLGTADQVDGVSGSWQMLPGYVDWDDIPQPPNVASRWNPFEEAVQWQM